MFLREQYHDCDIKNVYLSVRLSYIFPVRSTGIHINDACMTSLEETFGGWQYQ